MSALKTLLAPAALAGLIAAVIVHAEGLAGLRPFLNLEAFAIVCAGTLAALFLAYPAAEIGKALAGAFAAQPRREEDARRDAAVLQCAAESAAAMGLLGTVLGLILMLSSLSDITELPRRLALALAALFFGLFLSECVLAPLARRAARGGPAPRPSDAGIRFRSGLAGLLIALTGVMSVLYALSAALTPRNIL